MDKNENIIWHPNKVTPEDRQRVLGQKGLVYKVFLAACEKQYITRNPDGRGAQGKDNVKPFSSDKVGYFVHPS